MRSIPIFLILLLAAVSAISCATAGPAGSDRSGRPAPGGNRGQHDASRARRQPTLPAGVRVDDGLSRDEAVAVALWNNAAFQVSLSQLGFARADLARCRHADQSRAVAAVSARPEAARGDACAGRSRCCGSGRRARGGGAAGAGRRGASAWCRRASTWRSPSGCRYADLCAGHRPAAAGHARPRRRSQRIDTLTQSRLAAGDIGELEARAARVDAARGAQDAERAVHDVAIARERLAPADGAGRRRPRARHDRDPASPRRRVRRGRGSAPARARRAARRARRGARRRGGGRAARVGTSPRPGTHGGARRQRPRASRASRPDRASTSSLPIFNRNQGGRLRAETELQRASAAYVRHSAAGRPRRARGVRAVRPGAGSRGRRGSSHARDAARRRISPTPRTPIAPGESSYLFVLENSRRLIEARLRERETRRRRAARAGSHRARRRARVRAPSPGGTSVSMRRTADVSVGDASDRGVRTAAAPPPAASARRPRWRARCRRRRSTTLTLTSEATDAARHRDGAGRAARASRRTRSLGGEVLPAGGAQTTVTAPFAGTLGAETALPRRRRGGRRRARWS